MHAELKALDSPHALDGLDRWVPDDADGFAINITATIGPVGSPGGDLFYVQIVGPRWFIDHPSDKGFRWTRGYLVLDEWDLNVVERVLNDLCLHAEGPDWAAVAAKLARYGLWEFEDYRESPSSGPIPGLHPYHP